MTLVELAKKWFGRLQRGVNEETLLTEERREIAQLREQGRKVWLEYHENEPWAIRKADAGLVLTPEGIAYMEREIQARKYQKEHDDRIKQQVENHDGQTEDGVEERGQRSGPAPRPGTDGRAPEGDGTYRPESGAIAASEPAGGLPAGGAELASERGGDGSGEGGIAAGDPATQADGSQSLGAGAVQGAEDRSAAPQDHGEAAQPGDGQSHAYPLDTHSH